MRPDPETNVTRPPPQDRTFPEPRTPAFLLLLVISLPPTAAPAQETQAGGRATEVRTAPGDSVPVARAARRSGPIEIDGRIAEDAWSRAPPITGFVQSDPSEGAPPAQPTTARFLYDDDAIYVAARMEEPDASVIRDQLVRRDQGGQYDYVEVALDPNLDRQTGYLFRLAASGSERDAFLFDDSRTDVDFDAVWTSAVSRDSSGWSAEMRIPLSQFEFPSADTARTWGFNVTRRRLASNSTSQFSLVSRTVQGRVSQFGLLRNVDIEAGPHFLEVEPFVASDLTARSDVSPENPFSDGTDVGVRPGANLTYGVSSNFTLDATVNPDFGQTEVDPTVVNLSPFETFFAEKRPFFVQEFRVFDFDLAGRRSQLLFTRRIGRQDLQGEPPTGADFTTQPDRNTILGAGKLTGRTDGGLSVGALGALTREETGRAFFEESGEVREFVAQPQVGTGVLRLQQDLRDGATSMGLIGTALSRSLPADGSLDALPAEAFSFGADVRHEWGGPQDRRWRLSGYYAGTHVRGDSAAMIDIQTNSQHFFQRPDADDLSVDSTSTHLTGANWSVELARQSAEHLTWRVLVQEVTPHFAVNDLGFSRQGEQLDFSGNVTWQETEPGDLFRDWRVSLFTFHEFRHSLLDDPGSPDQWTQSYKDGAFFLNSRFELLNNWRISLGGDVRPESLSDTETRGGPLMVDPAGHGVDASVTTDPRNALTVRLQTSYSGQQRNAGHSFRLSGRLTFRPTPAWEFSVGPTYRTSRDAAQFVTSTGEVGYEPTFGRRHLFADLEREQVSMDTRLEFTVSPDLSLQFFGQPLLSANDFTTYKQLARPSSFEFLRFEEGDPRTEGGEVVACEGGRTCLREGTRYVDFEGDGSVDFSFGEETFNLRSFVGDAVLRWEYLSGSTLFLVWRQDRRDLGPEPGLDVGRELDALLEGASRDEFILKVQHFLEF